MPRFDAIIPAGGTLPEPFAAHAGVRNKALIDLEGRTMLSRTLQALKETGEIRNIVLVTDDSVGGHPDANGATVLPAGRSAPGNILSALRHLSTKPDRTERVLVVTSDLPYLTSEILNRFIALCPQDKDFCVPLVTAEQYEARFPDSTSSYVKLNDGRWTIGGAYLVNTHAFEQALPHIERAFEQRKSTMGMVKLLGPAFAFRFLTKRLSVPDVLGKVQSIIGASGHPVMGAPPELAFDIDDEIDYDYARKHFQSHG